MKKIKQNFECLVWCFLNIGLRMVSAQWVYSAGLVLHSVSAVQLHFKQCPFRTDSNSVRLIIAMNIEKYVQVIWVSPSSGLSLTIWNLIAMQSRYCTTIEPWIIPFQKKKKKIKFGLEKSSTNILLRRVGFGIWIKHHDIFSSIEKYVEFEPNSHRFW